MIFRGKYEFPLSTKKKLPSWELTYTIKSHYWVDDFPNFPRWDMLVPWRVKKGSKLFKVTFSIGGASFKYVTVRQRDIA